MGLGANGPSLQSYVNSPPLTLNYIVKLLKSMDSLSVLALVIKVSFGDCHNDFFLCSRNRQTGKW